MVALDEGCPWERLVPSGGSGVGALVLACDTLEHRLRVVEAQCVVVDEVTDVDHSVALVLLLN